MEIVHCIWESKTHKTRLVKAIIQGAVLAEERLLIREIDLIETK